MGFSSDRKLIFIALTFVLVFFSVQIETFSVKDLDDVLALYDKPLLPLTQPKVNRLFELPLSYHDEAYTDLVAFALEFEPDIPVVSVTAVDPLPDFGDITAIGKRDHFSLFIPKHRDIATKLIDTLMNARDLKELISLLCYVHGKINPYLYVYALSVTLMNREETKGINIPNHIQVLPDKYLNREVFYEIKEQLHTRAPGSWAEIYLRPEHTASDLEIEHRVAYWREDIALNSLHWHWHLSHPGYSANRSLVDKDRRGESFYYVHQQMLARYNAERLCNHLNRVQKYSNWYVPIPEAYFPKLDSLVSQGVYPSRPKNMILEDIEIPHDQLSIDVSELVRYRDRIFRAIDLGYAEAENGTHIPLNEATGIDILGNMVEATMLSPNSRLYGSLHNNGHLAIGHIHDPKHYYLESTGVMGLLETAMRDPMFYRWHSFINGIFQEFKETLKPYTPEELEFPGVRVVAADIRSDNEPEDNTFVTFWQNSTLNLTHGVDFARNYPVLLKYTHLQHRNFSYKITVENKNDKVKEGTCRIFLAPRNDETKTPWSRFLDQRHMFFELDRFNVTLNPSTNTTITRRSVNSSVTIPFEQTFHDFNKRPEEGSEEAEIFYYGGCGWPHHLLIPKGTEQGFPVQLFVMISDYEKDKVENANIRYPGQVYCGIIGTKYPDKRPMGYPFDRLPANKKISLKKFLTPNMFIQSASIKFLNRAHEDTY